MEVQRTPPAQPRPTPASAEVDVGFLLAVFAQAPVGVARLVLDLRGAASVTAGFCATARALLPAYLRTLGIAGLTVLAPGALLAPGASLARLMVELAEDGVDVGGCLDG